MKKYPVVAVSSTAAPAKTGLTAQKTKSNVNLTPNPVETSSPIYGGFINYGYWVADSYDTHQQLSYTPLTTLPIFNQLVTFDINYKECVLETIFGDLADSWQIGSEGTEITFKLHRGVKWHDGIPFTADDVIYSLDKMTDPNRSNIHYWFPAYQNTEKIDDYTVKVHLKYPSAGFMLSLAQGESQIQAAHLAGVDSKSTKFLIGTGPYMFEEYKAKSYMKYKRNLDYWKKDNYGNQLPYLDGLFFHHASSPASQQNLIDHSLDFLAITTGASNPTNYKKIAEAAPDLLWQKRNRYTYGSAIFLNFKNAPIGDIRVRRAFGLLIVEDDFILKYGSTVVYGTPGIGLFPIGLGLPKEEVAKILGWDQTYEKRVAEAQNLMAEAGYSNGLKLRVMSAEAGESTNANTAKIFAEKLHKYLNIETELINNLSPAELKKRLDENNYDIYTYKVNSADYVNQTIYFGIDDYADYSKYSNPKLDSLLADLDQIIDPDQRREAIWNVERILLNDLAALPCGCYIPSYMPYYPWVKNMRWNYVTYSNAARFEGIWIDESLRSTSTPNPKMTPTLVTKVIPAPSPKITLTPSAIPTAYKHPFPLASYNVESWPVIWVSVDPPNQGQRENVSVTVVLKVPPNSKCDMVFHTCVGGGPTYTSTTWESATADANGNVTMRWLICRNTTTGYTQYKADGTLDGGYFELTNTKADESGQIKVLYPYSIACQDGTTDPIYPPYTGNVATPPYYTVK